MDVSLVAHSDSSDSQHDCAYQAESVGSEGQVDPRLNTAYGRPHVSVSDARRVCVNQAAYRVRVHPRWSTSKS